MSQQLSTFSETEKKAAERYKWWVVYLVREKRRLAGITQAVQAAALPAEEFLLRAERGEAAFPDPLTLLEDMEGEDPQTTGVAPGKEAVAADAETGTLDAVPLEVSDTGHGEIARRGKPADGLATAFAIPDDKEPKTLW